MPSSDGGVRLPFRNHRQVGEGIVNRYRTEQTPSPLEPAPAAAPVPAAPVDVYDRNCDAARAAGAAPIFVGEPGYRPGLDRDGDGTACDS
jgi:hypothetical protein